MRVEPFHPFGLFCSRFFGLTEKYSHAQNRPNHDTDLARPLHHKTVTVTACGRIGFNRQKTNLCVVFAGPSRQAHEK